MRRNTSKPKKKYLIALEETRSIVALVAGILIFVFAFTSIFLMTENHNGNSEYPLNYFTVWANVLSATSAAFMIPFAAEGIRKKRFILPHWIVLFQYAAANSLAITMVSALTIILPTQGITAISGLNLWFHIITPTLTIVLFQSVETGTCFKRAELFLALIPYWVYMAVYFYNVVIIGEKNGGWNDFYLTQAYWSIWISMVLMLTIGFVVSIILFILHNKRAAKSWGKIKKMWSKNLEPQQLLIEAFGLGRYMGERYKDGEIIIPLDIFMVMSKQYDIPPDKLTKAYVKGVLDAVGERKSER